MKLLKKLPSMDLMRSEEMIFFKLIIPVESAHRAVSYLGELGLVQFKDLNDDKSPFKRTFVNQVKLCGELSRKLRFFKDQMNKAGLLSSDGPVMQPDIELKELEVTSDDFDFLLFFFGLILLTERERELIEMNANSEQLRRSYSELLEFKIVLQKAGGFLVSAQTCATSQERELDVNVILKDDYLDTVSLLEQELWHEQSSQFGLRYISGIVCKSKALSFEKMLFRATRGNMLFKQAPVEERLMDPVSTEMVCICVFVFFPVQSDHFDEFFAPELDKHGYQALYKKKTTEVYTGTYAIDGCATFSRRDRFSHVKKYEVEFNKAAQSLTDVVVPITQKKASLSRLLKDNVALIAVLEAKFSNHGADTPGKRQLLCVVEKAVFVVFFSGEKIKTSIVIICEAFGANRYPVPEDITKQRQLTLEVLSRLSDLEATLDAGKRQQNNALMEIELPLQKWMYLVRKEKAVCDTLNMLNFDVTKKFLLGEGWCPIFAKPQIQNALERAPNDINSQMGIIFHVKDTMESPPTHFRTNRFTGAFQEIVDAYGIARYQEANPTVYTVITFPFLFAVMFGDWGHGICLLLGALILIAFERKIGSQKLGSFMEMAFGGRYVILLMALFSIYCGLIYNEFFSVPFHIFGETAYRCRDSTCSDSHTSGLLKFRGPYPFGVDPSWRGSRTELPFLNSLKMKMSILLGVTQMNLGILLSYLNAKFYGSSIDIWCQFVPQVIFLNSLFGYLALLIVIKWCTGSQADLYHVMIYMFLSPTEDLGENQLFRGQKILQFVHCIILLADYMVNFGYCCCSLDALTKALHLEKRHSKRYQGHRYGIFVSSERDLAKADSTKADQHHQDFNFSEVFVHQMIQSIEFALGAVSNTASYLRLWALSLAHSELSTIFYQKLLLLAWGSEKIGIRIAGLVAFPFATVSILLVMETLSAFLHALRLHWVEFMN
ncbi:hypothetical protein C5167_033571 [Papaver somniferum]|uniref:V-type proton ATPase subunit a n=1 Tax=Papaver somniferum TaxID=3469 RepID=A0A4Y7KAL4_PAPSO|nr:hypothetical protein C5167_033571 [Papaver somniferum]